MKSGQDNMEFSKSRLNRINSDGVSILSKNTMINHGDARNHIYMKHARMILRGEMKQKSYLTIFIFFMLLSLVIFSCDTNSPVHPGGSYIYHIPQTTSDGWETAGLEQEGLKLQPYTKLMNLLDEIPDHYYQSILLIKNGKLVFEEYFSGQDCDMTHYRFDLYPDTSFNRDMLHCLASVSKSVTSILVGIAFDKGLLQTADQKMFSFFPDYQQLATPLKNTITLQHMLSMTSGMLLSEEYPYNDSRNELNQMWHAADPVHYALAKDLVAAPGSSFKYDSGTSNLLGEIVRRVSGMSLSEFARQNLFAPLGITNFIWVGFQHDPEMKFASSALYLRPRDMAKIGQLCLQNGTWDGQQIVSEQWIHTSTQQQVVLPEALADAVGAYGYGYQWWLEKYNSNRIIAFSARGYGSQYIVTIPETKMVVVFTGGAWEMSPLDVPLSFTNIVENFILPSIK